MLSANPTGIAQNEADFDPDERRTEPAHPESISEFGPAISSGIGGFKEEIRTKARR